MTNEDDQDPAGVSLTLSQDEALVLSDFLHRILDGDTPDSLLSLVKSDAEIWALNAVSHYLERLIPELFTADYGALIDQARARVMAENGGKWPS